MVIAVLNPFISNGMKTANAPPIVPWSSLTPLLQVTTSYVPPPLCIVVPDTICTIQTWSAARPKDLPHAIPVHYQPKLAWCTEPLYLLWVSQFLDEEM